MFRAQDSGGIPGNDALTIGHVTNAGTLNVAAQVIHPGAGDLQAYEFNSTGLTLLSNITSGPTPLDSILDIFLQDDTMLDFIQLWVWYGPGVTTPPPTPLCSGMAATIVGTSGNDNITGTSGNDVIVGLDGNDAINGGGGNDVICGDGGRDTLGGGPGNDTLDGGIDIDTLNGATGNDTLRGGSANDILRGQQGNDSLDGGSGNDICLGGPGNDNLVSCNP
jgi:Ca2+-binding RTX toxin-like protein